MVHVILDDKIQEIDKLDLVEEPISVDNDECNDLLLLLDRPP